MPDRRFTARAATALIVPALLLAACGGATGSTAPDGSVPSDGAPSAIVLPSDGSMPSFDLPSFAIPSFDLSGLITNLDGVESYRVVIGSLDDTAYSGTIVTKPVAARDLHIGEGDGATHIVTIGDEAWVGDGDGPMQSAPDARSWPG